MKKKISVLLAALAVLLPSLPALAQNDIPADGGIEVINELTTAAESGTCGENLTWTLDDNGTLTISGKGEMDDYYFDSPWYSSWSSIKTVIIANGVTTIGRFAFYDCTALTSVTIPDSVTEIGDSAFYDCTALTSVTIPDSVTTIGNWAFDGCTALTFINVSDGNQKYCSIDGVLFNNAVTELICCPGGKTEYVIPDSVNMIGNGAFVDCTALTSITIPDSVTEIGYSAFFGCTALTSITIPDSVTEIGDGAFYDCTALTSIDVSDGNQNYCSIDGVLFNKAVTELIRCPGGKTEYVIPDSVTEIGDVAFVDCTALTSITIPDSVTEIGNSAFAGCTALTSVTIGDSVTTIGRSAFSGCTALTSVTIPDSVNMIGIWAFDGCTALTSITIPDSVTEIGDGAFSGCTALTSVTIPDSVTKIGPYAFDDCSALKTVRYCGSVADWSKINIRYDNEALQNATIIYNYTPIVLTAIDVKKAETDGAWQFSVTVGEPRADFSVFAAVYDENGNITGMSRVTLDQTGSTFVSVTKTDKDDHARIFVWNDEMEPLTKPAELDL